MALFHCREEEEARRYIEMVATQSRTTSSQGASTKPDTAKWIFDVNEFLTPKVYSTRPVASQQVKTA
jgi:hypothetical protein